MYWEIGGVLRFYFFFFKQKTAYEIGLGIPAEPLFRSFSVTDTNSSRTSEAALWPSTYISPLSKSTTCIRKDRISSKSLMRLSICLWKPRFGGMKTYYWEGVNPDGYFLDKLEPIPAALPSFQKLFQVSATALSIP